MRYFEQHKGRIEIIPMIDIMLFLLVVFVMITLRMIPASGVGARLPSSRTAVAMPRPTLLISLREDGSVLLDGISLPVNELAVRLRRYDPTKTRVTIAGAGQATVQSLLRVLDACRSAGLKRVTIAAYQAAVTTDGG